MKNTLLALCLALLANPVFAAGGHGLELLPDNVDVSDQEALQRGAATFRDYCFACHSLKYMRYNRMAEDLGIPEDELRADFLRGDAKVGSLMTNAMTKDYAKKAFGAAPPDLTLVARVRGEDWIYTYLKSFYADPARPFGVNNTVFPDVGMPHVLVSLQGLAEPEIEHQNGLERVASVMPATGGKMSPQEYDSLVRDLVTFLSYTADPVKLQRQALGVKVILFLLVFLVLAILLKREYWKDVH